MHVDFSMFIDRPHVMRRVGAKQRRILAKTGGYGRTSMKRLIKRPLKRKKPRTVRLRDPLTGREDNYYVPPEGPVLLVKRKKKHRERREFPAPGHMAYLARLEVSKRYQKSSRGQPPRRGPTDLLRKHIYFGLDLETESVVIGPMPFESQPPMLRRKTVPELLNRGGYKVASPGNGRIGKHRIGRVLVRYVPHPFVEPVLPIARKKMRQLIKEERNRF